MVETLFIPLRQGASMGILALIVICVASWVWEGIRSAR